MESVGAIQKYKHIQHMVINCIVNIITIALAKLKPFHFTVNGIKGFTNTENKTLASIFNKIQQ